MLIDLNDFRSVNRDFGLKVGDELLRQVAARIGLVLRADDRCYHLGGDEFAVLLPSLKSPQLLELAARKLISVIGRNISIAGSEFAMVAQIGGAIFPDQLEDGRSLLQAADMALDHARQIQCGFKLYDQVLSDQVKVRSDLRGHLKLALERNDLMLHYQPQIDLVRGVISGSEALMRWQHAEQGWIRPDVFIDVAESSDLIDTLTYWSLNVALREWFQHCGKASASAAISVNLSAKVLHSPEVVELVRQAMSIWGAVPGSLVLEVTESAMMSDPRAALNTLRALGEMGVILSIDDFGTGYSSLAYLKRLPVTEVKIDKSFVIHMAEDRHDRQIVQAVINMAHSLDLKVVAEGIENQQSLDMLIEMGCDFGQGYFIARPMPIADLPPWAEQCAWKRPDGNCGGGS